MNQHHPNRDEIEASPARWFLRGLAAGGLIVASLNAASYFVRSSTWGSLVGARQSPEESIGFPWKIWEGGNAYGGMFVDYPRLLLNVLFATVVGSFVGWMLARRHRSLNAILVEGLMPAGGWGAGDGGEDEPGRDAAAPIQFSIMGLMIATTIAAVVSMLASRFAARPETLVAIFLLGPLSLVLIVMLPQRLTWQQRVKIIVPLSLSLIGAAIGVRLAIGMPFDQVLMGVFLCWTPQSALAAMGLTGWLFFDLSRRRRVLVGDEIRSKKGS